ncbi:MAG TPA: N-acyl homoserine lactonase family protein [Bryobacteraceae bacterium]|nr:N-acyl homoserine lactonase family protein [Bryobacteraceae bacterium]
MSLHKRFANLIPLALVLTVGVPFAQAQKRPKPPKTVRLYVFDNGVIKGLDPALFHFKAEDLATTEMVVCSYLIVHPKGTLMWDSGAISDANLKDDGSPVTEARFTATRKLKSQLASVGYAPKDVTYFGLSHYHNDHIANANDFAGATWLVQQPERDAMFAKEGGAPMPPRVRYAALENAKTEILKGQDYDVFGDGTVVVKPAYGHSPGHQVLYVKLAKTGPILLAGDLYHYQEERNTDKTPTFDFNREQSLASRAAVEAFIKKTGAQLWIEHDLANFNKQKKAPGYYE